MTREEAKREIDFLDYYLQNHTDDYGEESHTAMMMAIQALEQTQWIPCSEKLPEEETAVLISCEDLYLHRLNPCIGWRNGQYWNTFTANGCKQILYPTAWMPLPEPWKGE